MRSGIIAALVFGLAFSPAFAIGPHELLVIANGASADSVRVAREYMELRGVPDVNLVLVDLPQVDGELPMQIPLGRFREEILTPVMAAVTRRGLDKQIAAWAYSIDLPFRVLTDPAISLTGATFVRGKIPDFEEVDKGRYVSALFAGNGSGKARVLPKTFSFDVFAEWLGDEMPLPAMMLGYTGRRGNSVDTVLRRLRESRGADGTSPTGTVYFVDTEDIRSTCREWQFPGTIRELERMGLRAELVRSEPRKRTGVLGVMMGAPDVHPAENTYLPGSMAEHLTSAGAAFDSPGQTKITAWIQAGAASSAGTVVEPYALWQKFPHARFWVHYASGCTLIESYYQSVRCPLQLLPVGDPLCAPWAKPGVVRVEIDPPVNGGSGPRVRAESADAAQFGRYAVLLNGVEVGQGREFIVPARLLRHGTNTLRVAAYRRGLVRSQTFSDVPFRWDGAADAAPDAQRDGP